MVMNDFTHNTCTHTVLYSGKEENVVIESSMMQDSQSETEGKAQDRAEHSPLLTEEDTSSEEIKKLSLKTTTHPQVNMKKSPCM